MEGELQKIESSAKEAIKGAQTREELENTRIHYLGREQGALTVILRGLKSLPESERGKAGAKANELRITIESLLKEKEVALRRDSLGESLKKEWLDVTRPGSKVALGHLHPITKVLKEAEDIFLRMGFSVAEGPEIETEHYNFDALNIPPDHPARDMWDTFWLKERGSKGERLLLRTHTSPVQIRYMEMREPPVRIIVPGLVYRYEATDASHDIEFWQLEGLMIDRDITAAHFKGVMQQFFTEFFGNKVEVRLRPSFFPFVEPGFEVDISCAYCKGKGCSVCSKTGWLELLGAGMVHPKVLKNVGYNPRQVQGFAFGMGLDRLVMMKYKIPDVRLMRSGDLRFLNQF